MVAVVREKSFRWHDQQSVKFPKEASNWKVLSKDYFPIPRGFGLDVRDIDVCYLLTLSFV